MLTNSQRFTAIAVFTLGWASALTAQFST